MTQYILSTMTSGVSYTFYDLPEQKYINGKEVDPGLPRVKGQIHIAGGKGIPSLDRGFGEMSKDDQGYPMWTPSGMVTPISDEAYANLKEHPIFQKHVDGGFLKVLNSDISTNHAAVDKIAATMTERDGAAQLTPSTIKDKIKGLTPEIRTGDADDTWDGGKPTRLK